MAIDTATSGRRSAGVRAMGLVAGAVLMAVAGCGDDDDGDDAAAGTAAVEATEAADGVEATEPEPTEPDVAATEPETTEPAEDDEDDDDEEFDVDNCTLLTNEEASALYGSEIVADEDSPLGCPYTEPGGSMGLVIVTSERSDGDLATLAAERYPNAASVTPLEGIGDEALAITTPAGDAIAELMARDDDLVARLVVVFVDIDVEDPAAVQAAGEYVGIALERLVAAA